MLDNLSLNQLERALEWLASPLPEPPPLELQSLSELEWYLLHRLLDKLWEERQSSPLH